MENASKALLIAGELLIGVIVLSILALMFTRASGVVDAYKSKADTQKQIAFNSQFTKYITQDGTDPTYIYTEDVVTLVNKVLDWNSEVSGTSRIITLEIKNASDVIIYSTSSGSSFNTKEFFEEYKITTDNPKEYGFTCSVDINPDTGVVNKINIKSVGLVNLYP